MTLVIVGLLFGAPIAVWADGRQGDVEWSDGHKLSGAISLMPGKDLRLFTKTGQVAIQLDEVKEIDFKPEKEEMREGFYFPNAGQATQAKTGEIYPTRSLLTQITLSSGKVLEGHLFTTTLYVETDDATQKVVLMAKQTGANGQKLADLIYPASIRFDGNVASAGPSQIDLTDSGLSDGKAPVLVGEPDLLLLPLEPVPGKRIWTFPKSNSAVLFSVEASDGIHVAWPPDMNSDQRTSTPPTSSIFPPAKADPVIQQAVETSLKEMQDFYDTRMLLGCFAEADDVYSLVMMKRVGPTNGFSADRIPWSLVLLHWKYDSEAKKTTLLNRVSMAMGRAEGNSPLPKVFIETELLRDIFPNPEFPTKTSKP